MNIEYTNLKTETKTEVDTEQSHIPLYDVVIIGAGPAGMTAALYAARAMLKVLLIDGKIPGGQMSITDKIENYPGIVEPISGMDLSNNMEKQIGRFGIKTIFAFIEKIKKIEDHFILSSNDGKIFLGKTVIIATGWNPKKLDVKGEPEFRGRGVSYCATCDGPFYKDKTVVVVGGGDSAVKEGVYLTRFAKKIYIVHRRNSLRAEKIVAAEAYKNQKIEFVWDSTVDEIVGEGNYVTQVIIHNVKTNQKRIINADGVFIYIGAKPNTKFVKDFIELDEQNFIITNEAMETSIPGVYAAGDVRVKTLRQVVTAVSDGAIAADNVDKMING